MTHLHIPDGVIPPLWWVLGFVATGLGIAVATWWVRRKDLTQQLPVLGVVCALMIIVMNIPLAPGYHLNFSALAGILVGPALGILAAFIVVLLLALMGHGGLTTVGLNTLIIGTQCLLGWLLFRMFRRPLGLRAAAGTATILTLLLSSLLLIGVVALAGIDPLALHHDEGVVHGAISIRTFAGSLLLLGLPGWLLETILVVLTVSFLARLRPDLLEPRPRNGGRNAMAATSRS